MFALGLLATACGGDGGGNDGGGTPARASGPGPEVVRPGPEGDPRTVRLGLSSLPPELTSDAYIQAFATAAQYADTVLIQRNPPWSDFLPGGQISGETADATRLETELLKQYGNLQLIYAIDPTDGVVQRSRLANLPPEADAQKGFLDPAIRNAFVA